VVVKEQVVDVSCVVASFFLYAPVDVLEEEVGLKEEREFLSSEYLSKVDLKTQLLDHVLLTRDDVVITPHNAFNSNEALIQILDTTILNIKAFLMGKYQNLVKTA
jgi:D-lactate dehydrogenase